MKYMAMYLPQTNGCYQRFVYFCKPGCTPRRIIYKGNPVKYGNAWRGGRRFAGGLCGLLMIAAWKLLWQ
jgi:hypothetical protein